MLPETGLLVLILVLAAVISWLIGKLHEARRQARGFEGESMCRLEMIQQLQERIHELEK